ncbi:MAG: AzlC family ABC transporter permease, partial [Alphaproteobacteria bacterium]|nr:AzlC family ABC transporter permease [Alphaproteobacteria bacterium]
MRNQYSEFLEGARDIMPLAFGVAIYGSAFGLLAAQANMSSLQTALMGFFVFAGSSQIIAAERLVAEAGILSAAVAGIAINLRLFLMTAALQPELRGRPIWQIMFATHITCDENWSLMYATRRKGKEAGFQYLLGGGAVLLVIWLSSTSLSVSFAQLLPKPESIGMDFAFSAAFIAILCGLWRGKEDIFPWMTAIFSTILMVHLTPIEPSWALAVGGLTGAVSDGYLS